MTGGTDIERRMEEATNRLQNGDAAGAARLFGEIAAAYPDLTIVRHLWGIALHQLDEEGRALELLRESVEREPGNIAWRNNLGNVLTQRKRLDEAVEAFEQALALEPQNDSVLANLGAVYQRQKRYTEAEEVYQRAAAANPQNVEVLTLLASLMKEQDRPIDSARFHARALIARDDGATTPYELGKAHLILEQVDRAAEVYRRWLEREPGNPTALHLYASCSGVDVPERCSASYVEETFDAYASTFEQKLGVLSYRGPELIGELLPRVAAPGRKLDILDACCGTGLCAPFLKPFADKLTGVDLSRGMLDRAGERQLYTELVKSDLDAYLRGQPGRFDLIACADALIYFGDLKALFASMAFAMGVEGVFLFTVESGIDDDRGYRLTPTGRYRHGRDYVGRIAGESGLELIECDEGVLRTELGRPVGAWAMAARKTARS